MSILKIDDLRARSIIDQVTGCWHWQGARNGKDGTPRIWTFCHAVGDKRTLSGPAAVWNIAHGESPLPGLAYRRCVCTDCVNPVHHAKATNKAAIGLHIKRNGIRKGTALEARRANVAKAHAARGITPTPASIVLAIRAAPAEVTGVALAHQFGVGQRVVSRIRLGKSHKDVVAA